MTTKTDALSDRELLELAAKAAGIALIPMEVKNVEAKGDDRWIGYMTGEESNWTRGWFDPLTDDGDALRLAVRLNIPVFPYDDETSTGTLGVVAKNWGGKEENTRRAIVRAAAEIGRSMP